MDESMFLLSSSMRLKSIEKFIKNLEDQTEFFNIEIFLNQPSKPKASSSSTSWREMKENQRIISEIQSNEIRSASPLNLYKIFQQKCNTKSHIHPSTSTRNLSLHKSLPDLSFISHYSKELPPSPLLQTSSINIARTTPSPTLIHQHKQDSDRPRTLKSIKRYKNSKHSTEPLNIFYSPQLRKSSKLNSSIINDQISSLTKRTRPMRRCQTDIIHTDPILHRYSLTDSPPNEFCLQQEDKSLLNLDEPVPLITDQSFIAMNTSILDHILQRISGVIKRLFELQRSDKIFFLNNEQNSQLDCLLKNDLCPAIQTILEHGRKDIKKVTLWKIIQISVSTPTEIPQAFCDAKQIAQNASSCWLYRFQAFIFALLNKNELINWLYYFTRQKDIIQRYYQSPDALILVSISSTFNFFERIMTQLEKLTCLTFHLTYHPPSQDEQCNTRDWVMTLSRRTMRINSNDTFRSTLSRKFNSIFK